MKDPAAPFSLDDVRALAQVAQDFDLWEVELQRQGGERLRIRRAAVPAAAPVVQAAPPARARDGAGDRPEPPVNGRPEEGNVTLVTAPFVGTFYRAAGPDAAPFIEVGQKVRKGQTLCIIEAMKLMNELESEVEGEIVACLTDNGRTVEYGEPLFRIRVA